MNQREYDRDVAILTTRLITSGKYIVIDTETTGLTEAEACQIAWVLEDGQRFTHLVKPTKPIEPGAQSFHHVSDDMVKNENPLIDLLPEIEELSKDRFSVFYNSPFDIGVIARSTKTEYSPLHMHDAMLIFSAFINEWDEYHGNYKWHKLGNALRLCGISTDETLHDASADAFATREILIYISKQPTNGEKILIQKELEATLPSPEYT